MERRKCPRCGGEDILNGSLTAPYGFTFIPDTQNKVFKKSSYIVCSACKDCGAVFDLTLADQPNKLTSR